MNLFVFWTDSASEPGTNQVPITYCGTFEEGVKIIRERLNRRITSWQLTNGHVPPGAANLNVIIARPNPR